MGNIIVGVLFIIGGVSGALVLRGTGSSMGLAVLGVVLVIVGLIQLSAKKPKKTIRRRTATKSRGQTGRSTQARRRAG